MNTSRAVIDRSRYRSRLDRRLFGGFLEHLGRAVYEGVYDPSAPQADRDGFRSDLLDVVSQVQVPIMRYPGGNFVSGYNWLDGVGPREQRPTRLDKAWNSTETNQFGTDEFMKWCRLTGSEPMLVFNLGTNTPEMAAAYVEYCNVKQGTRWSNLRHDHGVAEPYNVRYWCLGNELDGPWQQGHMSSVEYGDVARETASLVRAVDPNVQLIAAGSSNTELPTYGAWDREILERCYDHVDAISLHNYYGNTEELTGQSTPRFLAMNLDMERQIQHIAGICDSVQARLGSTKKLWLAFDEWNIWYRARTPAHMDGKEQIAPRLLEEVFNLEDALLTGGFINSLLRQSDRVRIGCLAQIVNVIAPLVTNDESVLKQPTWYPYAWALKYASGKVLGLEVATDTYPIHADGLRPDFARDDRVPYLDVAVTVDETLGRASVFVLNRDLDAERELTLQWNDLLPTEILASETITGHDLKANNTFDQPNRVIPGKLDVPDTGSSMTLTLPAASYSVLSMAVTHQN